MRIFILGFLCLALLAGSVWLGITLLHRNAPEEQLAGTEPKTAPPKKALLPPPKEQPAGEGPKPLPVDEKARAARAATFADKAKAVKTRSNLQTLDAFVMLYASKFKSVPPENDGLRALFTSGICSDESLLTDAWGHPIVYKTTAPLRSQVTFDIYSPGPDGQADTEDDIGNW